MVTCHPSSGLAWGTPGCIEREAGGRPEWNRAKAIPRLHSAAADGQGHRGVKLKPCPERWGQSRRLRGGFFPGGNWGDSETSRRAAPSTLDNLGRPPDRALISLSCKAPAGAILDAMPSNLRGRNSDEPAQTNPTTRPAHRDRMTASLS